MKDFVSGVVWGLIVLAILGVVVLIGVTVNQDSKQHVEHNRQQIAECKALGGFARTDDAGQLQDCTFPRGER